MLRVHPSMNVGQMRQNLERNQGVVISKMLLREPPTGLEDLMMVKDLPFALDGSSFIEIETLPGDPELSEQKFPQFDIDSVPTEETFVVGVGYSARAPEVNPSEYEHSSMNNRKGSRASGKGQVLDGYKLLEACGVDLPEEVVKASVASWEPPISSVVAEHLEEFTNLTCLDVSGNNIPLGDLSCLPALQELQSGCSELKNIKLSGLQNAFSTLMVLDLSYNFLSVESVKQLGLLPVLADLNLAGNDLPALPPDLSGFRALRKLSLRRNRLGQQYQELPPLPPSLAGSNVVITLDYIFLASLSSIPRLEELDLSENHLQAIPPSLPKGFTQLKLLNLSYNFIDDQRKLVPLSEWPVVEWVDVRGNLFNVEPIHKAVSPIDAYPLLYRWLVAPHDVKVVVAQPKPAYMQDESHILRRLAPPIEDMRQSEYELTMGSPGLPQITGSRGGSTPSAERNRLVRNAMSPSQKKLVGPHRRSHRKLVTDSDELAKIFGLDASDDSKPPAGMTRNWNDTFLTRGEDEEEDDYDDSYGGDGLVSPRSTRSFEAAKAAKSLKYALTHQLVSPRTRDNGKIERLGWDTELTMQRQRTRRQMEPRTRVRGKVAEVYAKMNRILDALDGQGTGAPGVQNKSQPSGRREQPGPKEVLAMTEARVRNRRQKERHDADMRYLLKTVNSRFNEEAPNVVNDRGPTLDHWLFDPVQSGTDKFGGGTEQSGQINPSASQASLQGVVPPARSITKNYYR